MCVEGEPKHIYNLFHFRSESVHSLHECPDFHRLGPVEVRRNRPAHGLGCRCYKEVGRTGNGLPRLLNIVLWHLGYNSIYMRMTATVRNQQVSVFVPSCLLCALPVAALPPSASGLLLANVSMGLSFCPCCLRWGWSTEPSFPSTFPILAPKFLQPGDTWSPGHLGLLVTPTCIPFPYISLIFFKKKGERSDRVS